MSELTMVGMVPAYANEAGEIFADAGALDSDGDGYSDRQERRLGRFDRRSARIDDRRSERREKILSRWGSTFQNAGETVPREEAYSVLTAKGLINRGGVAGLGAITLAANVSGTLSSSMTRTLWIRNFVMVSDATGNALVAVNSITLAGIPVNVGNAGAPLSMFGSDATRFNDNLFGGFGSSRAVQVGQQVSVVLTNLDTAAHTVQIGLVVDEVNPSVQNAMFETMMLQAASGASPCR